jgi:VWFA-related protein
LGFLLEITTGEGDIQINGMVGRASLETETGSLHLTLPWRTTRLRLDSEVKPADVSTPSGFRFSQGQVEIKPSHKVWRMRDRLGEHEPVYGELRVRGRAPESLTLENFSIPPDWPVKMPWQAPPLLDEILSRGPAIPPPPAEQAAPGDIVPEADSLVFRSDVRMVNLALTVTDHFGQPVSGLTTDDFRVTENGVSQKVSFAGSDSIPFNLAILLDLSGSTRPDRKAMLGVAERFVSLIGAHDRVALYALAGGMFHVLTSLTSDRDRLLATIRNLPPVSGASPLYDTIVLAYGEELRSRPGQRNALIVISDGIDNQVSHQENPSKVNFNKLVKASAEMDALIYPVFLLSGERFGRNWSRRARRRMEELASASGGRLFPAVSIQDLQPVLPALAEELRSVYSVAYYPENQNFDGAWRRVKVEVTRPGVVVRARPGYYAR